MRRVAIVSCPGRARSESEAELCTSGLGERASTFGRGSFSVTPSPSATACASSSATFCRPASMRSRIARVWTLLSSKRKAAMICRFSTSLWLFQNSVAWL
jgi:hypothetical protein